MAREKVDNKLNVVIGTKAQIERDASIPENSIIIVTDDELKADAIVYNDEKNVKKAIKDLEDRKVDKANIVDNLTTDDATKVLSAKRGKELQDNKVDKQLTIIGLDLQDNILIGEFRTALGNATQSVAGLLSAEDKTHLDSLVALLETSDGNNVVDTIGEILAVFQNYPEGADLVTALQGKVDKVEGKGLSENDLTDTLKSNYDTAYGWGDHATENYLKEITKAMIEALLTGTITSHDHDGTYEPADANIQAHIASTSNPHGTTKEQVGLGSVLDYDIATKAEAEAGTSNEKYMTPLRTKEAILELSPPADLSALNAHIASTSNPHGTTKEQVGLGDVDNTSDLDKPISTAQQTALDDKVDKVTGKGLSTNDYTTDEKDKLAGIEVGAEANVQSDWNATSGAALILNKPTIPTKISDLTDDSELITTETDPIFTAWDKSTGISITKSQVSDLLVATQLLSGLMSATDKQRLDALHALLEEDTENNVVDSINEVLAIFNNYPEGADLITALAGKVDKVEGMGLSTNDFTDDDKSNYDTAFNWGDHAVEGYLKEITKAMIEALLTGTITSHDHDGTYEPTFTKNTAFNKDFGTTDGTVAQGNDSRFSDARTPLEHTHGNITTDGKIGTTANLVVQTDTDGVLKAKPAGTLSQYLRGDGEWGVPPKNEVFTSVLNGLVPAPYDYETTKFLRQDRTWVNPTEDFYTKTEIDNTIGDIESALDAILDYSLGDIETGYNVTINVYSLYGYSPGSWAYLSYSFDGGTNWIDLTSNTLPITINDVTQIMFKITGISPGDRILRNITDDVTLLSDAGTTSNLVLTKNTTYEVGTRGGGGGN